MTQKRKSEDRNALNSQIEKIVDGQSKTRKRQKRKGFVADLRVHSPAALVWRKIEGIESAPAMVRLAKVKGLDVLALTDYYSGAFIDEIRNAAEEQGLLIIPGFDIKCSVGPCSDVEFTCLLPESYGSKKVQEVVEELGVPTTMFGNSSYSIDCSFDTILSVVDSKHSGVMFPTCIDKTPIRRSIIPVLVERYGFRTFDLSYPDTVDFFASEWPDLEFHLFSFSNARALAQVGSRSATLKIPNCSFGSIRELICREL